MRTLAILGLATLIAFQSASAAPPVGADGGGRWAGVPNLPLHPPANMAPGMRTGGGGHVSRAPGQWSGGAHWQGRTGWARPGWQYSGWQRAPQFRAQRGVFLPPVFISPSFYVSDWHGYGLPEPGNGRYWMRYDDDALLLDGRGYVYDVVPRVDWRDDRPDGDEQDEAWYQDDAVTCCGGERLPYAPNIQYVPAGAMIMVIQSPAIVTTTTTYVEEEIVRPAPKKLWKAKSSWKPRKVWKPRPQCRC